MPSLKSILPFWRHAATNGQTLAACVAAKSDDFGKASGFELQFDRLMGDPEARPCSLFPTGNCR